MAELLDELLARCRRGDENAAAALVKRFAAYVLDLAMALLQDEHLAEDAMQAAFVTALTHLDQLREPAAFAGWLRQIVRTEVNRITRARRERPCDREREVIATGNSPAESAIVAERALLVRNALACLPPAARDAAQLFYLYEMSCDQVADRLGVPTGTVKRRLHDARKMLAAMLLGTIETPPMRKPDRGPAMPL